MNSPHAAANGALTNPALQAYPRNQWYVAAFSSEVGRSLMSRRLLDEYVAFYRTEDGRPVALADRCPHRGLPLSKGKLVGDRVQCGYHGLEYGTSGRCERVPSQESIPPRLRVTSYPLIERWQWIWIWMGDPECADPALLPDQVSLGVERPGFTATPFFHMEMAANYQLMHDNLLDTSHLTFLHSALLDSGDMAGSRFWVEEDGPILRLGREIPNSVSDAGIAAYFRIKPDHPYHRTLIVETHVPSVNTGKQTIHDPADPDDPPRILHVINALTPASARTTHVFHVQVTSYEPNWTQADRDGVRFIVDQDKQALEVIQQRFDELGAGPPEISVKADMQGLSSRKKIIDLVRQERAA